MIIKVGPDINLKLAAIVKSSFIKKLADEKMKSLMDTYHRPQNCESLMAVKVIPEIWTKLKYETKTKNLELQKTQAKLNKAVTALCRTADTLLTEKDKGKVTSTKLGKCVKQYWMLWHWWELQTRICTTSAVSRLNRI